MKSFREYLAENQEELVVYRGVRDYHQNKTKGTGLWFSTSEKVALSYSDKIERHTVDVKNAKIIDCKGSFWNEAKTDTLAREYKNFDIIILKNVVDIGPHFPDVLQKFPNLKKEGTLTDFYKKIFMADTVIVNKPELIN